MLAHMVKFASADGIVSSRRGLGEERLECVAELSNCAFLTEVGIVGEDLSLDFAELL